MARATRGGYEWTESALSEIGRYLLCYPAPIVFEIVALSEKRCTGPMRRMDAGIVRGARYSVDVEHRGFIWREHYGKDIDRLYAMRAALGDAPAGGAGRQASDDA